MIDWSRVDELRAEIGAEDFAEVVTLFFDEADEVAARLPATAAAAVEGELHLLKGSALNLGLADLAALCQSGERAARAGQAGTVDLAAVVVCYLASKADFLATGRQSAA